MQPVRHHACRSFCTGGFTFDRNAVVRKAGTIGQTVLTQLPLAIGKVDLDADVLTRLETGQGLAISRLQNERAHIGTLINHAVNLHIAQLTWLYPRLVIQLALGIDQGVSQQPIRFFPSRQQIRGCGIAQGLLNRTQQMTTHNRVMLCRNTYRGMLVHDPADDRPQRPRVINVGGVRKHG